VPTTNDPASGRAGRQRGMMSVMAPTSRRSGPRASRITPPGLSLRCRPWCHRGPGDGPTRRDGVGRYYDHSSAPTTTCAKLPVENTSGDRRRAQLTPGRRRVAAKARPIRTKQARTTRPTSTYDTVRSGLFDRDTTPRTTAHNPKGPNNASHAFTIISLAAPEVPYWAAIR
jgi:hypothetical protein